MSNILLLQAPRSPGQTPSPKHNRGSSVYTRTSCDSTFSCYTGATVVAGPESEADIDTDTYPSPPEHQAQDSRFSTAGPCDGSIFYIYDKPLPPLPREARAKIHKPLPPLPLTMSRRKSRQNIGSAIQEPRNDAIYYDGKEVFVHDPFIVEKVVMMAESWDDKEKAS